MLNFHALNKPWLLVLVGAAFLIGLLAHPAQAAQLITDTAVREEAIADRPAYNVATTDPVFGTTLTRVSNNTGTALKTFSGTWGSDARQHYSKDQPWNSTSTIVALQNNGRPTRVFLDGEAYLPKFGPCSGYSGDDRWHPSTAHPNERINVRSQLIEWYDVVNCRQTRSWTLPITVRYFGMGEGNPSGDGRLAVLSDGQKMFVVDMDPAAPYAAYPSRRIGPLYDLTKCGLSKCQVDWVTMSASGKYAVASYHSDHPRVFDINTATLALTPRPMPTNSVECSGQKPSDGYIFDLGHADVALNPYDHNEDVLVGQRRGWCSDTVGGKSMGNVIMVRLKDNAVTSLTSRENTAAAHHISARNNQRPGWVYVGFYRAAGEKFNGEVLALKLDGSGTVERLAHHHSTTPGCYRCEVHAVPSPDGQRVLFASNWTAACAFNCGPTKDIKAYVADTRALASTSSRVIPITADTYIRATRSRQNFGRSSLLEADTLPKQEILLQFQVPHVAQKNILSAKLRLRVTGNGTPNGGRVYALTTSWNERQVTWTNALNVSGRLVAQFGSVPRRQWLEIDISSLVTKAGTYNVRLTSSSADGVTFYSREFRQKSLRPRVVLSLGE